MVEQLGGSQVSRALGFLKDLSFLQTIFSFFSHAMVHRIHCNLDSGLECICEARCLEISISVHALESTLVVENL